MSESDRNRNKKKMWIITAIVVVLSLIVCGIAIYYNRISTPTMLPSSSESSSELPESVPPLPQEPESQPEESLPEEENEPAPPPAPPASSVPSSAPASQPAPVTPTMVSIDRPGTFSTPSTYRQIVITSKDVILKNKTVTGNLFVMDTVGEGDVTLENVIVNGTLYLYGGGANTVTLRDVKANNVLLQKDNGTLGVLATGQCDLGEVTIKCDTILTEDELANGSAGFDVVYVNEGAKNHYNIALKSVGLSQLTVNTGATVNLNNSSSVQSCTAQAPLRLTGSGSVGTLVVKNNQVSYENAPGQVDVQNGYEDPTHGGESTQPTSSASSSKDWDEGGSYTNGGSSVVRLSMPRNLSINYNSQTGAFEGTFSPVSRSIGYVVTPYLKNADGLAEALPPIELSGEKSTTAVLLPNAQEHIGQELRFKVYALGNADERTLNSDEATTPYTQIARLATPTGLTATFNRDSDGGNVRFDLQWAKQNGVRGYNITVENKQTGQTETLFSQSETYAYSFDRSGGSEKHFVFTVTALSDKDTVRIDSLPCAPVTAQITILPDPSSVLLRQEGNQLVASWSYDGVYLPQQFRLTVLENGVVTQTLNADPAARGLVLYNDIAGAGLSGKTLSYRVSAIASKGYGDSLDIPSNSVTVA